MQSNGKGGTKYLTKCPKRECSFVYDPKQEGPYNTCPLCRTKLRLHSNGHKKTGERRHPRRPHLPRVK